MCTAPRGWLSWCPSCMWRGQPGVRFPQMGEVGQRHPSMGHTDRDTHPPKPRMCIATMTTSLRTWAPTSKSSACWKCRTWNVPGGQAAGCCTLAQTQELPREPALPWTVLRLQELRTLRSGLAQPPVTPESGQEPRCENKVRIQFSSRDPCTDGGGSPCHPRGQQPRGQVPAMGVTSAWTLCCS